MGEIGAKVPIRKVAFHRTRELLMRWLVEVSAIGKGETQSFCVDADSWQRALQIVRAHRGDSGAMSGFSIELLEEGYRAVDPVARQRFVVKRASEGTPLSPIDMTAGVGGSKPPPGGAKSVAPAPPEVAQPEPAKPEPTKALPAKAEPPKAEPPKAEPPKAEPPKAEPAKPEAVNPATPIAAESKPKGGPPRPGAAKVDGKSVPPAAPVSSANGPATLVQPTQVPPQAIPSQPETLPAPTVVAPQPVGAPLPGLPAFTVLSRREEHPSSSAPLSYREYVFVVPPGTAEGVAVGILLGQLDLVQASLSSMRSGKLVQLAIFDESYVGKPPRPPLATLVWKDWRGEPVVSFPRRASVAPPGSRPAQSAMVPPLKPASIPPKATLLEPKTTLDDTRALKPGLPPPDTEVTRTDLDINVHALAKTTETPVFVPPAAIAPMHKATMLGIPTQAFGSPDAVKPSKSVPPPAPSPTKSVPPPAPAAAAPQPVAPAPAAAAPASLAPTPNKSVPPPAPEPVAPAPAKSVPPPPAMAPAKSVPPPPMAANAFAQTMPLASGHAIPPPAILGVEKAPDFTPPPGRSSSRIPIPKLGARVSGDELITALFEAMHDLHFLRDAIEGADFCLQLAQEVIPSRAGYAHFFDIERREFCLVRAKGEDTAVLVGNRHLEGEPILSAAVKARRPLLRGSEDAMTNRYIAIGGAKSLVLAPVMVAGRTLAVFEMVNPNDGAPFTQDEANAMNYIAEQFGEFLSSRGLVFDHGRSR
jgi:hypothetical protein